MSPFLALAALAAPVLSTSPPYAEEDLTFTVTGADPGALVVVVAGRAVGAGPCAPPLQGCLDVTGPLQVVGSVVADPAGAAFLTMAVPRGSVGATFAVQAVTLGAGVALSGALALEVEGLLEHADLVFTGEATYDYAGRTVGLADLGGGPGLDLVVGSGSAGPSTEGRVYVVRDVGARNPGTSSLAQADTILTGSNSADYLGDALSVGGDVDGDGRADLLVGARGGAIPSGAGEAHVFLAANLGLGTRRSDTAEHVLIGENTSDEAGYQVALVGDLDGDGGSEVATSAPWWPFHTLVWQGRVYVTSSGQLTATFGLGGSDLVITGDGPENLGLSMAELGDADGDGLGDLALGAPRRARGFDREVGRVYLAPGGLFGAATIPATALPVAIDGMDPSDQFGYDLAAAGDVDGDGLADLLASGWSTDGIRVFLGSQLVPGLHRADDAAVTIEPVNDPWINASGVGDLDGDGLGDVALSNAIDDVIDLLPGAALSGGGVVTPDVGSRFVDTLGSIGVAPGSLASGDLDGDGRTDLAIGLPSDSRAAPVAGAACVLLGAQL